MRLIEGIRKIPGRIRLARGFDVAEDRLARQDVHNALETEAGPNRNREGNGTIGHRADALDRLREVRLILVHHVDHEEGRHPPVGNHLEVFLGVALHARHAVDDDERGIAREEARIDFAHEVGVTRAVEQVDLLPLAVELRKRKVKADLPLHFIRRV